VRREVSAVAAAGVVLAALVGLAGCGPAQPLGVRKDGDRISVLVGRQCVPASYLVTLTVYNFDPKTREDVKPPLWEIRARQPRAVPSVVLGVVPAGYAETVNNLTGQGVGKGLDVIVKAANTYSMVAEVGKLRDGKVLDANLDVVSEQDFRERYGC
jgi:hypothetical protein